MEKFQWNSIVDKCVTPGGVATLSCLPALLKNLINGLLIFAGATAVILVIFSGIRLITSGGDSKQVEGARQSLSHALIGLIVILLSFFIINLISYVTNVGCIKQFGFTNCSSPSSNSSSGAPKQTCAQAEGSCVNEDSCSSGLHEIFGATCPGSSQICCK